MPIENENLGALAGATEADIENIAEYDRAIPFEKQGTIAWLGAVAADASLSPQSTRVACRLALLFAANASVAPKQQDLAEQLSLHRDTIADALAALTARGYLLCQPRRGRGRPSIYIFARPDRRGCGMSDNIDAISCEEFEFAATEMSRVLGWSNSFSRWNDFVAHIDKALDRDFDLGVALFWRGISEHWDVMDRIDHLQAWLMIDEFRDGRRSRWLTPEVRSSLAALPDGRFPIYRGQSARLFQGNSWTRDPAVAAWFAKDGIRGSGCPDPVVLVAEVSADDICIALDNRNEAEVILAVAPSDDERRVVPLAEFCAEFNVTGEKPDAFDRPAAKGGAA